MPAILTTQSGQFIKELGDCLGCAQAIEIVVGYMSPEGFTLVADNLERCLTQNGNVRILVGEIFQNADYAGVTKFQTKWKGHCDIRVSTNPHTFVHGKVYFMENVDGNITLILGSSNLTVQGLSVNKEMNVKMELQHDSEEAAAVREYFLDVFHFSIPLREASNLILVDYNEEEKIMIDHASAHRIVQLAEEVMADVDQSDVDEWCEWTDDWESSYQDIFTEAALFEGGEWAGEKFKKDFLMDQIWAVTEARHTDLWQRIMRTPSDRIKNALLEMIEAAHNAEMGPDDVLAKGRIPYVIGESIATEILHKTFPEQYAIKNKRSEWGLAFVLDQGSGPEYVEKMPYSRFIETLNGVFEVLKDWLEGRDVVVEDRYKYFLCDRLFWAISENPRHREFIKLYGQSRKDNPYAY